MGVVSISTLNSGFIKIRLQCVWGLTDKPREAIVQLPSEDSTERLIELFRYAFRSMAVNGAPSTGMTHYRGDTTDLCKAKQYMSILLSSDPPRLPNINTAMVDTL